MRAHDTPRPTLADGLHELPPGKIAAVATYLEMRTRPAGLGPHPGARFESLSGDVPRYRTLYAAIGAPWLWFSRAAMTDAQVGAIIGDGRVQPLALMENGRALGLVELDFRRAGECELAFLGLLPDEVGHGRGRVLVAEAIRRAFGEPIRRLWLHTCTLDHPAAMPLYLRAGFRPYRRAIEIADDPRLTGRMPANAAPYFPVV